MSDTHLPDSIAIAHRSYEVNGGGEHVAEQLARTFDAPLYTGQLLGHDTPADVEVEELFADTRLGRVLERQPPFLGLLKAYGWSTASALTDYAMVITSGPEPVWYMPADRQRMIAYCHSPIRWLYDRYHESDPSPPGAWFAAFQRLLYESAAKRPDHWVANSELVARRLQQHLDIRDSRLSVVYPPVDTASYSPGAAPTQDYYLYLGRLADHKRVDEVVEAFRERDSRLVIAGDGPHRDALEARATGNIEFRGYVSEEEKRELYAGAAALIYPPVAEDFGMVPIEAMASGTPVIGVREGYTQYQVQDGTNGLLFERGVPSLHDAVAQFERNGVAWSASELAAWARDRYNQQRFQVAMRTVVDAVGARTQIDPPAQPESIPGRDVSSETTPAIGDGGEPNE